MKSIIAALLSLLGCGLSVLAQGSQDPVNWTLSFEPKNVRPGAKALGRLDAQIQPGWHLYSLTTPAGGPIATTVLFNDEPAIAGIRIFEPKPIRKLDPNFQVETETFERQADLLVEIGVKPNAAAGPAELNAHVRYQCCSDRLCLPPRRKTVTAHWLVDTAASSGPVVIPAGYDELKSSPPAQKDSAAGQSGAPAKSPADTTGLLQFLLISFGFGIAAVFTPCVFPMIPITVSFFINRQDESRRASLMQATVFCLGIVVLFTGLGLLIKTIAGPFGVVRLGSSPWVNGFIALVFFAFGFSLLGAFELTLPNNLLTKLNSVSQGSSYISTLLMGLTFSLTSFACVGPIVGPLLIASVQSNGIQPMLGMMCFATGLAAPFFLLALFPSYLRRLPKSGSWMLRVKVVLGFVVLAAALKYLSNVDQVLQLGFLTRTRILAAWIILFGLAGLYLLGRLRIEGIKPDEPLTVTRTALGALFLTFALSLMPGLFGAPLGEIDAYVPASGPTLGLSPGAAEAGLKWLKNDYDLALSEASKENKVVLVNFTGYACTNCHWMKANMFTRPEMRDPLHKFILVDLYTDGDDAESQKNQALENKLFSTVAIPFYAIFSAKGEVLGTFPGLTRNPAEFLSFLNISERRDSRAGDLPEAGSSAPPTHKLVDEMRQSADEGPVFRM